MRKINMLCLFAIFLFLLSGCGGNQSERTQGRYDIYYVNRSETGLVKESYDADHIDESELIDELLDKMKIPQNEKEHVSLLEEGKSIQGYKYENKNIQLNMESGYSDLPNTKEVLVRAGLVRTLVQIDGVETVSFLVDGMPLLDSKGNHVGLLNGKSFIENSGKEINTYKNKTLTLYFTNTDGNALKKETRTVYYNSNVSLEQVVVEQLLKGPKADGCYKTLPENSKVMSVTVADKICYVNFDKNFADNVLSVQEQIPIYSIVDSIIENCSVNKVQILIAGESDVIFRETMKLSELYSMNRDLILRDAE